MNFEGRDPLCQGLGPGRPVCPSHDPKSHGMDPASRVDARMAQHRGGGGNPLPRLAEPTPSLRRPSVDISLRPPPPRRRCWPRRAPAPPPSSGKGHTHRTPCGWRPGRSRCPPPPAPRGARTAPAGTAPAAAKGGKDCLGDRHPPPPKHTWRPFAPGPLLPVSVSLTSPSDGGRTTNRMDRGHHQVFHRPPDILAITATSTSARPLARPRGRGEGGMGTDLGDLPGVLLQEVSQHLDGHRGGGPRSIGWSPPPPGGWIRVGRREEGRGIPGGNRSGWPLPPLFGAKGRGPGRCTPCGQ